MATTYSDWDTLAQGLQSNDFINSGGEVHVLIGGTDYIVGEVEDAKEIVQEIDYKEFKRNYKGTRVLVIKVPLEKRVGFTYTQMNLNPDTLKLIYGTTTEGASDSVISHIGSRVMQATNYTWYVDFYLTSGKKARFYLYKGEVQPNGNMPSGGDSFEGFPVRVDAVQDESQGNDLKDIGKWIFYDNAEGDVSGTINMTLV